MLNILLAGLLSLAPPAPTSKEPSPKPKEAQLGKPIELKPGESAAVAGLTVGFQGVSEDSRCPTGVQCIWEGDAAVEVMLEKPPAAKATRALHTSARHGRELKYEGLKIRLTDLTPQPKESVTTDAREYRLTLVVEEAR
jgi:hypothetical protein